MDLKGKFALSIMVPAFAFAAGYTVINKLTNKNVENTEAVNIDNALKIQSDSVAAAFKAQQELLQNCVECGD